MAIAEQQGLRPQENTENKQFTMDEVGAENEQLLKAKDYVLKGQTAKEAGDQEMLKDLNEQNVEMNLQAIKTAVPDFQGDMNKMCQISVRANAEIGRAIPTVFNDERGVNIIAKADLLFVEISNITAIDKMEEKLAELKNWFDPISVWLKKKFTLIRMYASGDANGHFPGDESSDQYNLYQQMLKDMENIQLYMPVVKNLT